MPLTLNANSDGFISLDEVKAQANITSGTSDDELELIRGAAQDAVEGIVGPVRWTTITQNVARQPLSQREWDYGYGGVRVALNTTPVVSVTSLQSSGVDVTYTADLTTGILSDIYTVAPLTVTYVAGRTVVPDAIRYAALIIAEHLWETQRGASPSPLQEDFGSEPAFGRGFGIPNRAVDLLQPYALLPGFA